MPNHIEDFTAYRLLKLTEDALSGIRVANGYNTDPLVTLDPTEAVEAVSTHRHVIYLDTADHSVDETLSGPNYRPVLTIELSGVAHVDNEVPRVLAMALEQDVRTAIAASITTVRAQIAKGCILRFEDCPHYGVGIMPEKQAGFVLSITWKYPQGSTW